MSTAPDRGTSNAQAERAEAEAVLASEMLKRAPSLHQILSYLCRQYFDGNAARIKEYNIGVEALGRGEEFDPNQDTIVRVEASRLRRRLREYYARDGADHPLQLLLPKSGYVPQFVPRHPESEVTTASGSDVPTQPLESSSALERSGWRGLAGRAARHKVSILAGMLGLAAGIMALPLMRNATLEPRQPVSGEVAPWRPAAPLPVTEEDIRILCGFSRPVFIDSLGLRWSGDRFFTGGEAVEAVGEQITGVLDPFLYRTARRGEFRYDIPLKSGNYELRLLFAETSYGKEKNRLLAGEGSRRFHVSLNGARILSSLDVFADAGAADVPADRVFKDVSPDKDGFLHLVFTPVVGRASLNGIEITPGIRGKMKPVRIAAGGRSYFDREGRLWGADRYFTGGRPLNRPTVVQGTSDPDLLANERWGNFSYSIPVVAGSRYGVTLKFAETSFGAGNPGKTGVGSRVFDVYCNGIALLRNFDVLKEAGENRAWEKAFHGLTPTAKGRLVLNFVPVQDYATVRAIEVVDEGP